MHAQSTSKKEVMRNRIRGSLMMQDFSDAGMSLRQTSPSIFKLDHDNEFESKYTEQEILGEGGAAVVKKCVNKQTGIAFAAKVMRKYDLEKEANSRREFELIKDLDHPNIIKAIEFIAADSWTYLVMEMAIGKELQKCEISNVKSVIK